MIKKKRMPSSQELFNGIFKWMLLCISFISVLMIFCIFIFILKESLPMFTDPDIWKEVSFSKLFLYQQHDGYTEAKAIWQPTANIPKYNLTPLIIGTLKITLISILIGAPIGILASIYTTQFASRRYRNFCRRCCEVLAGIPSVVIGFLALIILSEMLHSLFNLQFRLNSLTAGVAIAIITIPLIYTICEDVLKSIPNTYKEASLALGASQNQTIIKTILPISVPGFIVAVLIGLGRAIGETMIVLMVSGNAPILSYHFGDPAKTMAATIASEMGEVSFGSVHYTVLFFIGLLLFIFTFIINYISHQVIRQFKKKLIVSG